MALNVHSCPPSGRTRVCGVEVDVQTIVEQADVGIQTDITLPQRVEAYWHCCPKAMTIIDGQMEVENDMGIETIDRMEEDEISNTLAT